MKVAGTKKGVAYDSSNYGPSTYADLGYVPTAEQCVKLVNDTMPLLQREGYGVMPNGVQYDPRTDRGSGGRCYARSRARAGSGGGAWASSRV